MAQEKRSASKTFFNTSGNLYKELQLKDKLADMTEEEQLKLLATDGMLVKRPLLVTEDYVCPGLRKKTGNPTFDLLKGNYYNKTVYV